MDDFLQTKRVPTVENQPLEPFTIRFQSLVLARRSSSGFPCPFANLPASLKRRSGYARPKEVPAFSTGKDHSGGTVTDSHRVPLPTLPITNVEDVLISPSLFCQQLCLLESRN
jgi:hypothetical protein